MVGPVRWEVLKPHAGRDAVVVVNERLDLVTVGEAIAADNTQAVSRWINEQLIVKPTAEQLVEWSDENRQFKSLIVQPYVLVQDVLAQDVLAQDVLASDKTASDMIDPDKATPDKVTPDKATPDVQDNI